MTSGMKAELYAVMLDGFAIGQCLQRHIRGDARTQDAFAVAGSQVMAHPPACVVAMGVGYDGAIDRPPGVDIEITGRAIQPFGAGNDKIHEYRRFAGL